MSKETVATPTAKSLAQGERLDTLSDQLARVLDALAQSNADSEYEDAVKTTTTPVKVEPTFTGPGLQGYELELVDDHPIVTIKISLAPQHWIRSGIWYDANRLRSGKPGRSEPWHILPVGDGISLAFPANMFYLGKERPESGRRRRGSRPVDENPMNDEYSRRIASAIR